jgi:hypothetical protein
MYPNQMPRRNSGFGIFLVFLLAGLYFLNASLNFFTLPATLTSSVSYNKILFFIAGVLILIGGLKFLMTKRY